MNTRMRRPAIVLAATALAVGILGHAPTAYAADGSVSGVVTGPGDEALQGVTVIAWRPVVVRGYTLYEVAGTALTEGDGSYDLDGLPAGIYRVQFGDDEPGLATEFFADQSTVWTAQDLVLADAQVLPDIDATLSPDAVVSGRVTDIADEPMEGVEVTALVRVAGPQNTCPICGTRGWMEAAGTETLPDGTYVLDGLPAATYRIRFERVASGPLVTEYWEDKGLISNATDVAVDVDAAVTAIDAQLVVGEHDAEVQPTVQNTSLPTIIGSPVVGSPLTVAPGTWSPTPTEYRYEWWAGDDYVAASGATYVPTAADVGKRISVEVTAVVPLGDLDHGRAQSVATEPVVAAPVPPAPFPTAPVPPAVDVPTALATILAGLDVSGRPKVGRTVKVTGLDLVLRTAVGYRFQWFAGTKKIKKATRARLRILSSMKGKKISVKVTATAASTATSVRLKAGRVR